MSRIEKRLMYFNNEIETHHAARRLHSAECFPTADEDPVRRLFTQMVRSIKERIVDVDLDCKNLNQTYGEVFVIRINLL